MSHKKPITRRDFLGQGIGMTGSMILLIPSLQTLLAQKAVAAALGCAAPTAGTGRIPFLCVDLEGGANIAGSNVIVGKAGGQKDFLTSYSSLGLPSGMRPQDGTGKVNEEFGLAFHSDSGFLRGLLSATSTSTRAKIDGVVFCTASNDDTSNNPFNPSYWIAASGTKGGLSSLAGTKNTISGGNSQAPLASVDPRFRPLLVNRPKDALGLVQAGKLVTLLSQDKADKIGRAIGNLSSAQLQKFSQSDLPTQIRDLVSCGYINAPEVTKMFTPDSVDPAKDSDVTSIFPRLTESTSDLANNDPNIQLITTDQQAGTAMKLILDGFVGAATIEKGDNDYHVGNRSKGEQRDQEAGQMVGRAFELAARKGKDLAVYVFTDGGVGSNGQVDNSTGGRGKGNWSNDDGEKSATFMLVFRASSPRSSSAMTRSAKQRQIGWYRDDAKGEKLGVERNANLISNDVTALAKAVLANYLALHGEEGRLAEILGADPFGADLEKYLAFTQIRRG